jgi:thymidine phosphorylase
MTQPLAPSAGNALEVIEVMEVMTGGALRTRLGALTAALGGEVLALAGLATDAAEGEGLVTEALESGAAAECFGRMVAAQGGPADFVDRWPDRLPSAPVMRPVPAPEAGFLAAVDGFRLGEAVVHLGGGRLRDGDRVNPAVGLAGLPEIGTEIFRGLPLAVVHAQSETAAEAAAAAVLAACRITPGRPELPPLVLKRIAV